jgi:hypothetical protein
MELRMAKLRDFERFEYGSSHFELSTGYPKLSTGYPQGYPHIHRLSTGLSTI